MPVDATPLLAAVDHLADRFRAQSESRLVRRAGHRDRAAAGFRLAGELADAAQRLESPGRPPRRLPDAGPFAVGDQIAVAGHDLALALASSSLSASALSEILDSALRAIAETARLM